MAIIVFYSLTTSPRPRRLPSLSRGDDLDFRFFSLSIKVIFPLLFLFVINCAKQPETREAPPRIEDSFQVKKTPQEELKLNDHTLILSTSSLEKEFLLQSSMIIQVPAPTSSGLRSRIVYFKKTQNKIFMMESPQGQIVTQDLPSDIILAQFPILTESKTEIEFDFSNGMSQLFTSGEWQGHDDLSDPRDGQFSAFQLNYSYIKEARILKNQLYLSQIAQIGADMMGVTINVPMEVRYYLSPYKINSNFLPKEAPKSFDKLGFFETMPFFDKEGNNKILTTKFDETQAITFAISANTPPEYQEAVRDGITYWNSVYGKDIIKVVHAPPGVTAPNMDYNVVQWVPWDQAGFAYADAQVDPRTGEILHAQVYMTACLPSLEKTKLEPFCEN
jgi:hypothetical protein